MQDVHNAVRKRHLSLIARIAVATVAILWVLRGLDWPQLVETFHRLHPWRFVLILIVYTAAQVIIAVRWWLLLRAQSIHVDVLAAIRLFFLGLFYNNVMPGAVGGDLLKAWYVTKHTDRRLEGVLSVFVDRTIGLIGTVVMAVFTYFLFVHGQKTAAGGTEERGHVGWLGQHRGVILWVVAAIGIVFVAAAVHPAGRKRLAQAVGKIRGRGLSLLRRSKDAVVVYCSKPGTILGTLVLTFIGQSVVIVAFWLLGRDLGVKADLRHYFVVFPASWVIGAIPVSPAGLGITEAGIVWLFEQLTPAAHANLFALASCQRIIWVLSSLPGAVIHLLGAHLPEQEISIDGPEHTN